MKHTPSLLQCNEVSVNFFTERGTVHAVRNVSLSLAAGETLALVGESGSGKSVLLKAIAGILPQRGKLVNGTIAFDGINTNGFTKREWTHIHGGEIGVVFQNPMTTLDPTWSVGAQIVETIRLHTTLHRSEAKNRAIELLRQVGIDNPEKRYRQHPYQFSGGMRQRAAIAIALAAGPRLLLADEPTTALDVTVQAQVMELLQTLQAQTGIAILFVTHDLGVVAQIAHRIAVMYAGKIVELGRAEEIFHDPRHPYTKALLASLPDGSDRPLTAIPGNPPDLLHPPKGDPFALRNPQAMVIDFEEEPPMVKLSETHFVASWLCFEKAVKDFKTP